MRIVVRVPAGRMRRWHFSLADRLARAPGADVRLLPVATAGPSSTACELLIGLERLIWRKPASAADRVEAPAAELPSPASADVLIDLTGEDELVAKAPRTLRPLFDGGAHEDHLFAAILDGRMPQIDIEDAATKATLTSGVPGAEGAAGFIGAVENCTARVATLCAAALAGVAVPLRNSGGARREPGAKRVLRFAGRSLAGLAVRRLYQLCCHAPHWRIGWRFNDGPGVWERRDLAGPVWNVLGDPGNRFFADPVPVEWKGQTALFFEDWDHRRGKAVISVIEFDARGPRGPARPVLEEAWHLSYPFIIAQAGTLWMIPESSAKREVALYRLLRFPDRWERAAVLLDDIEASDATIVEHLGAYYMFAATRDGAGAVSDSLSIHLAPGLLGPWKPHVGNPVLVDAAAARPAGCFVRRDGRLFRPVQDCRAGYGTALALAEVTRLDEAAFSQEIRTTLRPGREWPGRKLHTLNRAGRLECIDGAVLTPKSGMLSKLLKAWNAPARGAEAALQLSAGS